MAHILTDARAHLKNVLETEFAPEGLTVEDSWIHPSNGREGPVAGTFPLSDAPMAGNMLVLQGDIGVQVFQQWIEEVDPNRRISPSTIEAWSGRFRRAVRETNFTSNNTTWYLNVGRIDYPPDPTGHRTRFEAAVSVYGDNPTLVETSG